MDNSVAGICSLAASAVQAAIAVLGWFGIKPPFSKKPPAEDVIQSPRKRGKLLVFLMVGYFITTALGLWLLFRNSNRNFVLTPPAKECPVTSPRSDESHPSQSGKDKKGDQGKTVVDQKGKENHQVVVAGGAKLDASDCGAINLGDNNTNNLDCTPKEIAISDAQVVDLIGMLKKTKIPPGSIEIDYEMSAENGPHLASQLKKVLDGAGIAADIGPPSVYLVSHPVSYPGLSFEAVDDNNSALADLIDRVLIAEKIIKKPLKRTPHNPASVGLDDILYIYIRKN